MFPRRLLTPASSRYLASTRYTTRTITMSAKKQEPKVLGTTDYQPDGFKWTRLKKIDWEDETGKKVRHGSLSLYTFFCWLTWLGLGSGFGKRRNDRRGVKPASTVRPHISTSLAAAET